MFFALSKGYRILDDNPDHHDVFFTLSVGIRAVSVFVLNGVFSLLSVGLACFCLILSVGFLVCSDFRVLFFQVLL